MAKELLWSEDSEFVYGLTRDFNSKEEFAECVKSEYEDGECNVTNVQIQPCIYSSKGIVADCLVPMYSVDVSIENYYTAEVEQVVSEEE